MKTESEIHIKIKEYIEKNSNLSTLIDGIESINGILEVETQENYLDYFNLDNEVKRKKARAISNVFNKLKNIEIITSNQNISKTKAEILKPDLLTYNPEKNCFIIFEFKKGNQTEREAITELMAYEQELKNVFPLLSDSQIYHVLLASDWKTLLKHSVENLVVWENKNILPLSINLENENISILDLNAWDSISYSFRRNNFSTVDIALYPKDYEVQDKSKKDIDDSFYCKALEAVDYISELANKYKTHGFCFCWKDTSKYSLCRWNITVAILNPFSVYNEINDKNSYINDYFSKNMYLKNAEPNSLYMIAKNINEFLDDYFSVEVEGCTNWKQKEELLLNRSIPLYFKFIGIYNDFAKKMITSKAYQNFNHMIRIQQLNESTPCVAMELLWNFTGDNFFTTNGGKITADVIYNTGIVIGGLYKICHISIASSTDCSAIYRWYELYLIRIINELKYIYMSSSSINLKFPNMFFGDAPVEKINNLDNLISWMENGLITDNILYRDLFNISLSIGSFSLPICGSDLMPEKQLNVIKLFVINILKKIISEDLISDKNKITLIFNALLENKANKFLDINKINVNDIKNDNYNLFSIFEKEIIPIVSCVWGEIHVTFNEFEKIKYDWAFLKQKADEYIKNGNKKIAINLRTSGEMSVITLDDDLQKYCKHVIPPKDETEIYFINEESGIPVIYVKTWEELMSGNFACRSNDL